MTKSRSNTLDKVVNGNGNPGKRNKVGIVSEDNALKEIVGEELTKQDFNLTPLSLDDLANGKPQNFYFVDLVGFDEYSAVVEKIQAVRENNPDSELVLLSTPLILSRPQASPLRASYEKYLVPQYQRPLEEKSRDYKQALYKFITTKLSNHIHRFLTLPNLLKTGGSIYDIGDKNPEVLFELLEEVKVLHGEGYLIILSTGGGPGKDREADLSISYGTPYQISEVLEQQAQRIKELLGDEAEYIPPEKMKFQKFNNSYLRKKIPVVSLSGEPDIPKTDSDTNTLSVGEKRRLYKAIFAKDTDGVYARDPYIVPRARRGPLSWLTLSPGEDNKFFPQIYASEIINGVIDRRDSEGKGEHLIESTALMYLIKETQFVRAVQIINGTKPKLLRNALDGVFTGSYILKG